MESRPIVRKDLSERSVLRIGHELSEIERLTKRQIPMTKDQQRLIEDNTYTFNRRTLEAYKEILKIKALENWICDALNLENRSKDILETEQNRGIVEAFTEFIRDGVVLCQLINAIKPGTIKNINNVTLFETKQHRLYSFKAMENIWFFLDAIKQFGIGSRTELFVPTDLFEAKNVSKVINTLFTFANLISKSIFSKKLIVIQPGSINYSDNQMSRFINRLERDDCGADEGAFEDEESEKPSLNSSIVDVVADQPNADELFEMLRIKSEDEAEIFKTLESIQQKKLQGNASGEEISKIAPDVPQLPSDPSPSSQVERPRSSSKGGKKKDANGKIRRNSTAGSGRQSLETESLESISKKQPEEINYAAKRNMSLRGRKKGWNCNEIMKGLFLGDEASAINREQLEKNNISHILCVIGGKPVFEDRKYMIAELLDFGDQDVISLLPDSNRFIAEARSQGGSVLVHCQKGVSRSSAVVIGYVMSLGYSFYDAADLVCAKRPIVCPNLGFIKQLQLYEKMNFVLDGTTEHHESYRKIKMKSLMQFERQKWLEGNYKDSPLGDTFTADPNTGYRCSSCNEILVPLVGVINHGIGEGSPMQDADLKPGTPPCNCIFVVPYSWMGKEISDASRALGDIYCPSKKCSDDVKRGPIGRYDWNGLNCSCGSVYKPGFCLSSSQIKM